MADTTRNTGDPAGGSANTAIVAIVVVLLLAVVAFFIFFRPGSDIAEPQDGPDVELEVQPPAEEDVPDLDGGGGGVGDSE